MRAVDCEMRADITQYDTFQNLQRWVDKVNNEADKNCSIIIVGNKGTLHTRSTHSHLHAQTLNLCSQPHCSRSLCPPAVDMVESNPALRRVELGEAKVHTSLTPLLTHTAHLSLYRLSTPLPSSPPCCVVGALCSGTPLRSMRLCWR